MKPEREREHLNTHTHTHVPVYTYCVAEKRRVGPQKGGVRRWKGRGDVQCQQLTGLRLKHKTVLGKQGQQHRANSGEGSALSQPRYMARPRIRMMNHAE